MVSHQFQEQRGLRVERWSPVADGVEQGRRFWQPPQEQVLYDSGDKSQISGIWIERIYI